MVRKIFALLAGLIAANVIIVLIQVISGLIYGMPQMRAGDAEAIKSYVAGLPTSAFLLVALGYAVGYFVGGFVMRKISRWDSLVLPVILGVMGTIGWTLNIMGIPHPTWMIILGYLCFIPLAIVGHIVAGGGTGSTVVTEA